MLYTLNLHDVICKLSLKAGKKEFGSVTSIRYSFEREFFKTFQEVIVHMLTLVLGYRKSMVLKFMWTANIY